MPFTPSIYIFHHHFLSAIYLPNKNIPLIFFQPNLKYYIKQNIIVTNKKNFTIVYFSHIPHTHLPPFPVFIVLSIMIFSRYAPYTYFIIDGESYHKDQDHLHRTDSILFLPKTFPPIFHIQFILSRLYGFCFLTFRFYHICIFLLHLHGHSCRDQYQNHYDCQHHDHRK